MPALHAQNVRIPDAKFRERLIALGYDANDDERIQENEIADVRILDLRGLGLVNLEGIRAFKNLEDLDASRNPDLTTVDVSGMARLRELNLNLNTKLAELKVNGAVSLAGIYAMNARVRSLDLTGNRVSSLDLTPSLQLQTVVLTDNPVTGIKVRGLSKLKALFLSSPESRLTQLDLCGAVSLERLQW